MVFALGIIVGVVITLILVSTRRNRCPYECEEQKLNDLYYIEDLPGRDLDIG